MTVLNQLTFEGSNSPINTFTSDILYGGNIMYLSISLLCDANITLAIIWSFSDVTLFTETYNIIVNIFFNQFINIKATNFQVIINGLLGSNYTLQTFYH